MWTSNNINAGVCLLNFYLMVFVGVIHGREYCVYDNFHAKCSEGHVIEIQNATYGRMSVGMCIQKHIEMGCKTDVVLQMNRLCGGKQMCHFEVFDGLKSVRPCQGGLQAYLEASYGCVSVTSFADNMCSTQPVKLADGLTSHLSKTENDNMCTPPHWTFTTEPGKSIEITLHDYTDDQQKHQGSCAPLGYISEDVVRTNKTICSSLDGRQTLVYKSVGYSIGITILPEDQRSSKGIFVLKYRVIGCPDISLMDSVYYKRDGSVAKLGCSADDLAWTLKCNDNRWSGKHNNCSESGAEIDGSDSKTGILNTLKKLPEGVLLAIIIGVAVLLSMLVLVCGFMYIASRRQPPRETVSETYSHGPRRTDSEFKMYTGPTLRKSQEQLDINKPILYQNTPEQKHKFDTMQGRNVETCSCASYSSIPKMLEANYCSTQEEIYLDPESK